jgi:hypothetical protein
MVELFVLLGILHLTAVVIAAVILKDSIKYRQILRGWLVIGGSLVVHAVPSLVVAASLPPEGGFFVWFVTMPLAVTASILFIVIAACIAIFTTRVRQV